MFISIINVINEIFFDLCYIILKKKKGLILMEPKINLKNVSFAAQCTEASEEVVPHFVSDKIVEKVSVLDIELDKAEAYIEFDDISVPTLEIEKGSPSNFDVKMGDNFLIIKELPCNDISKIKIKIPYEISYANIKMVSKNANIFVPNMKCEIMKLDNIEGCIDIQKIITGLMLVDNLDGNVKAQKITAEEVKINNDSGNINIGQVLAKYSNVKTNTGSVIVKKSNSVLNCFETNGGDIFLDSKLVSNNSKGMN